MEFELPLWLQQMLNMGSLPTQSEPGQQGEGYAQIRRESSGLRNYLSSTGEHPEVRDTARAVQQGGHVLPQTPSSQDLITSPALRAQQADRRRVYALGHATEQQEQSIRAAARSPAGTAQVLRDRTNRDAAAQTVMEHPPSPLSREWQALADVVSKFEGTESYADRGYNTLVGGRQIPSGGAHPNVVGIRTKDGPSTAYGRFQFTYPTWLEAARGLGHARDGSDFPTTRANQDLAFQWLARQAYRSQTGRDLDADLTNEARWPAISAALGSRWASFPGTLGRNQRQHTLEEFLMAMRNAPGRVAERNPNTLSDYLNVPRLRQQRAAAEYGRRSTTRTPAGFLEQDRTQPIQTRRRRDRE